MTHHFNILCWLGWRRRRRYHVVIRVGELSIILEPGETLHMSRTANVGHTIPLSIGYLDQRGNPMKTAPVPDAAPEWTQTAPAVGTLSSSPDGLEAHETLIAEGTDTIGLSLVVGGVPYSATLDIVATEEPQVLTSVVIVDGPAS